MKTKYQSSLLITWMAMAICNPEIIERIKGEEKSNVTFHFPNIHFDSNLELECYYFPKTLDNAGKIFYSYKFLTNTSFFHGHRQISLLVTNANTIGLIFINLQQIDSGFYKCRSNTVYGIKELTVVGIDIKVPTLTTLTSVTSDDIASCEKKSSEYIVNIGTSLTFNCPIIMKTEALILWYKNAYFIQNSSSLSIVAEDNETYYCTILNSTRCEIKVYITNNVLPVQNTVTWQSFMITVCVFANLFGLMLLLTGWHIYKKINNSPPNYCRKQRDNLKQVKSDSTYLRDTRFSSSQNTREYHTIDSYKVPILNVSKISFLGSGNFAEVYKGKSTMPYKEYNFKYITVAIKVPKASHFPPQEEIGMTKLMAEIELHYNLESHINVIRCLGQTRLHDNIGIVLEFAINGNLKTLLCKMNDDLRKCTQSIENAFLEEINYKCIKFSREIASGMAHIAKNKIIHRDLAARNILISFSNVCKISDFGLARCLAESMEYSMSSNDPIPVRWLSPEALFFNSYSEKSDVWSFGILLWEIVSLGCTPYPNIKNAVDIKKILGAGDLMEVPKHCSSQLNDVMRNCWNLKPKIRPTFEDLERMLDTFLLDSREYINFNNFDVSLYENLNPTLYRENMEE